MATTIAQLTLTSTDLLSDTIVACDSVTIHTDSVFVNSLLADNFSNLPFLTCPNK